MKILNAALIISSLAILVVSCEHREEKRNGKGTTVEIKDNSPDGNKPTIKVETPKPQDSKDSDIDDDSDDKE